MRSASLFAVAVLTVILAFSLFSPVGANTEARLRAKKLTTNGDTRTVFHFTCTTPKEQMSFDLRGGEYRESDVNPLGGEYTVLEEVQVGWVLNDVTCVCDCPYGSSYEYVPGRGVIISYAQGDYVECTFTNSPGPAVGGVVMPANTFAVLAPWLAVIGLVGCIGAVAIFVRKRRP